MCKIEFFSYNFSFLSSHITDIKSVSHDYLTFEATQINISGSSKAQKGCFAKISGNIEFDGIVSDIQPTDKGETISVRPLQALFDFEVYTEKEKGAAQFIADCITENLISNADILQNRPIKLINNVAQSAGIDTKEDKVNLLNYISDVLKIFQIAVNCKLELSSSQKCVSVEILQIKNAVTVETDKPNIISKTITLGDSYGAANKILIRKTVKDKETGIVSTIDTVPFFLHTDGTISAEDTDRIVPVFHTIEDIQDCENWQEKALEKAVERLNPQQFDNEIIVTVRRNDGIISTQNMAIGTLINVMHNKKAYSSVLTGIEYRKDTVTLTMGCVRVALTKKLILERRNK